MSGAAEGPAGIRRASGGEVVVLVAALLLAPRLFVLAPLAGLLAAARPRSARARTLTLVATALLVLTLATTSGLLDQMVAVWAVLTAGAFVTLTLLGRAPLLFRRAAVALGLGTGGALLVAGVRGITWEGLERYAARELSAGLTAMLQASRGDPATADALAALQARVPLLAALLPGQLAIGLLLGLVLAWRWHEWTTDRPLGPAAARFREFRTGELWIWLLIAGLAGVLFRAEGAAWSLCANVLLLSSALYLAQGVAVVRALLPPLGLPAALLLGFVAAFLSVFVGAALLGLGLADHWYDFRRRAAAAASPE